MSIRRLLLYIVNVTTYLAAIVTFFMALSHSVPFYVPLCLFIVTAGLFLLGL